MPKRNHDLIPSRAGRGADPVAIVRLGGGGGGVRPLPTPLLGGLDGGGILSSQKEHLETAGLCLGSFSFHQEHPKSKTGLVPSTLSDWIVLPRILCPLA